MTNTQDFLDDVKSNVKTFTLTRSTYIAAGTGTTTPTAADTTLETETVRKARQEYTEGVSDVVVSLFLGTADANGDVLTETGALDASSSGNLMNHASITAITKNAATDVWIDIEEQIDVIQ